MQIFFKITQSKIIDYFKIIYARKFVAKLLIYKTISYIKIINQR